MALHFTRKEFAERLARLKARMADRKLDCMLLFAQESMFWLTGYDTFGYCFFQCLVVKADGEMVLLTRAPDLRQAQHTSILENIVIWADRAGPTRRWICTSSCPILISSAAASALNTTPRD